ncbi:hypothetical protein [Bacillus infantis]|uniref:hypothetical protein n=1 Tax=Bacillus infantis TaxID=324767 RepID=UPI003CF8D38F
MRSHLLCIISALTLGVSTAPAYAAREDKPQPLEEIYPQLGYKPVEEAVREFEEHTKEDLKLPTRLPPIPFTHIFGRFYEDKQYGINDGLSIEYINEDLGENHFNIDIRPLKNKIEFRNKGGQKIYRLQNGEEAIYIVDRTHTLLVFEKDHWQYMLGVSKRIANRVPPEMLVSIANSTFLD